MKWKLSSQTDKKKIYINDQTGTECELDLIYTDQLQRNWWGFHDLVSIPYIRKAFSQSITNLFQAGLSYDDLTRWIAEEKKILRSNDTEKYEKLYALVLEKETTITSIVDPLKQNLGLATVYVLDENERIDYFNFDVATNKLNAWRLDPESESFFLTWLNDHILRFTKTLENLSQIVLNK